MKLGSTVCDMDKAHTIRGPPTSPQTTTGSILGCSPPRVDVVELAYTAVFKTATLGRVCGFESHRPHHYSTSFFGRAPDEV